MSFRPGYPPQLEITRVRHRLSCGESLDAIASDLGRRVEVLQRHLGLGKPEVHPKQVNGSLIVTTPSGATISGLTLQELIKLARAL